MQASQFFSNFVELYSGLKNSWEQAGIQSPDSISGKAYNGVMRVVSVLTQTIIPTISTNIPHNVSEIAKAQLSKAICAFTLATYYDSTWLYNVALSGAVMNLDDKFSVRAQPLVRDGAICLLALHTIKAANNAVTFMRSPNIPSVIGCVYDVVAIAALCPIIKNNEPQEPASKPPNKTE